VRFKNKFVEHKSNAITPTVEIMAESDADDIEEYRLEDIESYEHLSKHYTGGRRPRTRSQIQSNLIENPIESFDDAGESIDGEEGQELI